MLFYTFSPICVPVNWQTELVNTANHKFDVLSKILELFPDIEIKPCEWPMGYGSLEHDNLPLFYQPAAVISLLSMKQENDVCEAKLYCYDNCLAILSVNLKTSYNLDNIDDLAISQRVEHLARLYLQPILKHLYEHTCSGQLISPKSYKFYADTEDTLCSGEPLWVARMLVKPPKLSTAHYKAWLQNVDDVSEIFHLGSGNSLLCEPDDLLNIQRTMVLSQFHAAVMLRTEELLKQTLTKFNGAYFQKSKVNGLEESVELHQYRNDHIEFINIQYSVAQSGVQGKRRALLSQFDNAWQIEEQQKRLGRLAELVQKRLDRFVIHNNRLQTRSIQTLLTFLGALSLVGLVADLASLSVGIKHQKSFGVLDVFTLISAEHVLNLTIFIVVLLTAYFYRNHE